MPQYLFHNRKTILDSPIRITKLRRNTVHSDVFSPNKKGKN
jgi:hypothetical protein